MNIEDIIKLYNQGSSLAKLSKETFLSKLKLKNILRENNIHIRSAKEQTIFTNVGRRKKVDDEALTVLTKENVW